MDLTGKWKSTEHEDEVKENDPTLFSVALGNLQFIKK